MDKDYPLQSRWLLKEAIKFGQNILGTAILVFIVIKLALVPLTSSDINSYLPGFFVLIVLAFLLFFLFTTYKILQRINFHLTLEDTCISMKRGIQTKVEKKTPYKELQTINLTQGRLDKLLGLASLTITTKESTHNADRVAGKLILDTLLGVQPDTQVGRVGLYGNTISIPDLTMKNAETLEKIIDEKMENMKRR